MAAKPIIDVSTLRQLISYNPETGALTWLPRPISSFKTVRAGNAWNAAHAHKPALTTPSSGYHHGTILFRTYIAHRVAWAIFHGEWPSEGIDHINGNRSDNRIGNLRAANQAVNLKNCARRVDNTSGVTGVYWYARDRRWQAKVGRQHIGYFDNKEDAIAARKLVASERGFHANHGREAA